MDNEILFGYTFVFTGFKFDNKIDLENQLRGLVINKGGRVTSAVSVKTSFLINYNENDYETKKIILCKKNGIKIITHDILLKIINKEIDIIYLSDDNIVKKFKKMDINPNKCFKYLNFNEKDFINNAFNNNFIYKKMLSEKINKRIIKSKTMVILKELYINKNKIIDDFKKTINKNIRNKLGGYLYIIKTRESIRMNENIYKIGCTDDIIRRHNQYPKGSKLLYTIIHDDYKKIEKKWIKKLNDNKTLIRRIDMGKEYYEGNYISMIKELTNILYLTKIFKKQ